MPTANDAVSNKPFRERLAVLEERDGYTRKEIAEWLGWDEQRLRTALGLKPGKCGIQHTVRYRIAVKLCDAMGLDYWEVGV